LDKLGDYMKLVSCLLALSAIIIFLCSCSTKPTEPLGKSFSSVMSEKLSTPIINCEPNPFIESTTISYTVRSGESVRIDIINPCGALVKTLVNDSQKDGNYSIIWNGTDSSGNSVSSGVYFYRMYTGSYSSTRKMILLK